MRERQLSAAKWLGTVFMALIFVLFAAGAGDARAAESGGQWVQEGDRWRYQLEDGSYVKGSNDREGALDPANKYVNRRVYYFDADGYMMTGWIEDWGRWYYADASGALLHGWQQIGGIWYYFNQYGGMEADTWVDGYYLNEDGAWVDSSEYGRWMQDANGWWYQYADGSYPAGTDVLIGSHYYYFDEHGYMVTGWVSIWSKIGDLWYYYNPDGSNAKGWKLINGAWYYFYEDGEMYTDDWVGTCYLNQDGTWDPTASSRDISGIYWDRSDNRASGQWVQDANGWWYRYADGSYPAGCVVRINGNQYGFDENGYMCTGWFQHGNTRLSNWYYADASGAMLYGWQQIGGLWYYFYGDGMMAASTYVDGYYLDCDGVWSAPTGYVDSDYWCEY